MDVINENESIANIVAKAPEYAKVFEDLGMDYCCKGKKALREACAEKNLNVITVMETLRKTSLSQPVLNWNRMSVKEIVAHIVDDYHTPTRMELQRISQLLEKVKMKHEKRYPYIIELHNIFESMKISLLEHMDEEEKVVFPLLVNMDIHSSDHTNEVKRHLASLDEEHLGTGEAFEKMKQLTNGFTPPSDACMTHIVMLNSIERLTQDTHEHIHCENHILFPWISEIIA